MFFPRQLFFDMDTYIESKPLDDQEFYREVSKLSQLDHVFCYSCIKGCKLSASGKFASEAVVGIFSCCHFFDMTIVDAKLIRNKFYL